MTYDPIDGTLVIGLTGRARHGKDLAAEIIASVAPGARRYAFSDAIAAHARVLGLMTARDPVILQQVGYDARLTNPKVWIDAVYGAICDHAPPVAIVTGVRFPDEAELVRGMGGFIIKSVRVDADGQPFTSGDRDAAHPTETAIDGIAPDYVVANVTGRIGDYRDAVLCTYNAILRTIDR